MTKRKSGRKIISVFRGSPRRVALSLVLSVALLAGAGPRVVHAVSCSSSSDCQSQINNLNNQNTQAQQSLNSLASQAQNYQDALTVLNNQIASVQEELNANEAKQANLQQQITANQQEIADKKSTLADDIKTMYVDGQMTTIEELATSSNLSDFVDKQQYQSVVQDQLNSIIQQINALQAQLTSQKAQVDTLLKAQQIQQAQLLASQNQQQSLLSYNQGQQDQFNAQIASNKASIASLEKQQTEINARLAGSNGSFAGGTGGYPWANAQYVDPNYDWSINGSLLDPQGWNYRNCTSYAFWKLEVTKGISLPWSDFPTVKSSGGRIGMSVSDFKNLGYTVDHNPLGATLAVWGVGPNDPYGAYGGYYGHIMYVESSTDSSAFVSDYNVFGTGTYYEHTINPTSYTWFVHIP